MSCTCKLTSTTIKEQTYWDTLNLNRSISDQTVQIVPMFDNSAMSVLDCFALPPNHIIRLNCHRTLLFFCPPICCQINPLIGGSYRSTRREQSGFLRHRISGCSLTALRLQRFVGSSPKIKLRYGRAQSLPPADAKPMAARRIAGAPPPLV